MERVHEGLWARSRRVEEELRWTTLLQSLSAMRSGWIS